MNVEIPDLDCSVAVETYASNGSLVRRLALKQATPRLCRDSSGNCVLIILDRKKNSKEFRRFTFGKNRENFKLFTRFVCEGKATLMMPEQNCSLFISNCAPNDLALFLKCFSLKCNYTSQSSKPEEKPSTISMFSSPNRPLHAMKMSKCLNLEKISPLTSKDLVRKVSKQQPSKLIFGSTSSTADQSTTPAKNPKRKLDSVLKEFTNCSPQSKRVMTMSMIPSPVRTLKLLNSDSLTDEQRRVVSAVVTSSISCFFTGSAGTGKSYLLKFIISRLPPESTFVTASTGISASQIKGITLHQFSGISTTWIDEGAGKDPRVLAQEIAIKLERNAARVQRLKQCRTLIIDEISMISSEFFEILDHVARVVRKNSQPFGGIQVVLCGDFLQLPPITKGKRSFAFQSKSWTEAIQQSFLLRKVQRQNDPVFISVLQNLRLGRMNESIKKVLIQTSQNDLRKNDFIPTQIFTHRKDVDAVNEKQLEKLTTESMIFYPTDSDRFNTAMLDAICPTTKKLQLKIGAQVMLNRNIDVTKGLVNGLVGRVISFETPDRRSRICPRIKFINDTEVIIQPEKWTMRLGADNESFAFREHLPLQLAWAISVHKSQGMTISSGVEVSLAKVFESGQVYVALSRATSLENIKIIDFNPKNVFADKDALNFYRQLKYSD